MIYKHLTNTEIINQYRNYNFVKFWDRENSIDVAFRTEKYNFVKIFELVLKYLVKEKLLTENTTEKIHFEFKTWNSGTEYLIIETTDLTPDVNNYIFLNNIN